MRTHLLAVSVLTVAAVVVAATFVFARPSYHRLATDQPLELALFDFLRSRMQRGKVIRRNAA